MYQKLIVAAVLIAFVGVQMAHGLNCYYCDGPNNCRKPSNDVCNRANANKTRDNLGKYFVGVTAVLSDNFDCFHTAYTQNKTVVMATAGCVYREQSACYVNINSSIGSSWQKQNCTQCSGNLCNKTNPAGTYSPSSYTISASILTIVLAKILSN